MLPRFDWSYQTLIKSLSGLFRARTPLHLNPPKGPYDFITEIPEGRTQHVATTLCWPWAMRFRGAGEVHQGSFRVRLSFKDCLKCSVYQFLLSIWRPELFKTAISLRMFILQFEKGLCSEFLRGFARIDTDCLSSVAVSLDMQTLHPGNKPQSPTPRRKAPKHKLCKPRQNAPKTLTPKHRREAPKP